ncbi:MAG: FAD binding domain-containing protein, partial [Planctomycetales bacterium]|nr:FAD binding domain-containing protein [Planctomycetales bacterium]
ILAGGTDLVGLLKRRIVAPDRVVDITSIPELQQIYVGDDRSVSIGATVHLDEFMEHPTTHAYPAIKQIIAGISSIQLQCQGTFVGELLRRPHCWYFRDGHGLLADRGQLVQSGDNRYHAILGNRGPAKFTHASRVAPALIALGAKVRIVGPGAADEQFVDVAALYQIPKREGELEHTLSPGQWVTHVILPPDTGELSAAYEVRHGEGPDMPLASAAVHLDVRYGIVRAARIVLGQVAPVPWLALRAVDSLVGQPLTVLAAEQAGVEAVAEATPLSHNAHKIDLARVAVKRAILRAGGLDTGGHPLPNLPPHAANRQLA